MHLARLTYKNSLDFYHEHWVYTFSRLSEDPRCAALLPPWQATETMWLTADAQQRQLDIAIVRSQQRVDLTDDELDELVDQIDTATRKKHPRVHALLFKIPPQLLKRPVLGRQLKSMATWPNTLTDSTIPELIAFVPLVQAALSKGATMEQAKLDAIAANTNFRAIGARKTLVDDFNALREKTLTDLGQIAKDYPEYQLSSDWPAGFFRRRSIEHETVKSLDASIETLEAKLSDMKLRRQTMMTIQLAAENEINAKNAADRDEEIKSLKKVQEEIAARLRALEPK